MTGPVGTGAGHPAQQGEGGFRCRQEGFWGDPEGRPMGSHAQSWDQCSGAAGRERAGLAAAVPDGSGPQKSAAWRAEACTFAGCLTDVHQIKDERKKAVTMTGFTF